jgi:hypothetical protein
MNIKFCKSNTGVVPCTRTHTEEVVRWDGGIMKCLISWGETVTCVETKCRSQALGCWGCWCVPYCLATPFKKVLPQKQKSFCNMIFSLVIPRILNDYPPVVSPQFKQTCVLRTTYYLDVVSTKLSTLTAPIDCFVDAISRFKTQAYFILIDFWWENLGERDHLED